jgi:hypothetical protein
MPLRKSGKHTEVLLRLERGTGRQSAFDRGLTSLAQVHLLL